MEPKKLSEMIRAKKKKYLESDPMLVDTDANPDMNPQARMDLQQKARIESTLDTPHKIDARDAMNPEQDNNMGLQPEDKARLERLRKYIDTLDLSM